MEPAERTADEWVIVVALAPAGERSHFYVVPRNHLTAAIVAYAGTLEDSSLWTAK